MIRLDVDVRPCSNFSCPMGIGHHASARASRLIAPAPPFLGMATTAVLSFGPGAVKDTGTHSSRSGGEVQSQPSCTRRHARSAGSRPWSAPSKGSEQLEAHRGASG